MLRKRLHKGEYDWFAVQQDIINEYKKGETIFYCPLGETYTLLTFKGYGIHIVPNKYLILDTSKFSYNKRMLEQYNDFISRETVSATLTEKINKKVLGEDTRLDKYTLANGINVYVNSRYLKHFIITKDIHNYELQGAGSVLPLYIYYYGELVGILLPVAFKEWEGSGPSFFI